MTLDGINREEFDTWLKAFLEWDRDHPLVLPEILPEQTFPTRPAEDDEGDQPNR